MYYCLHQAFYCSFSVAELTVPHCKNNSRVVGSWAGHVPVHAADPPEVQPSELLDAIEVLRTLEAPPCIIRRI